MFRFYVYLWDAKLQKKYYFPAKTAGQLLAKF